MVQMTERYGMTSFNVETSESWAIAYQMHCDTLYWQNGQCCAGCDHWRSDMGNMGECVANGILPGEDVMRSIGIAQSSHPFAPGFPQTRALDHCGKFKDDFDWSTLSKFHLRKIGAIWNGKMQPKPASPASTGKEG